MRYGIGLNTNIPETNIVNLLVVIGFVVTVVGDNVNEILHQRQQKVQAIFTSIDREVAQSTNKLNTARKEFEIARSYSDDINRLSGEKIESECTRMQTRLQDESQILHEKMKQSIQYERCQKATDMYTTITSQRCTRIVYVLTKIFNVRSPTKSFFVGQANLNIILAENDFHLGGKIWIL
jgi:F0F1-type ATP synthase membrane subunit b/b'